MIHTLWSLAETQARIRPDARAIECDGSRWTFFELRRDAMALAGYFAGSGLSAGSRIAFLGRNTGEFVVTLFACAYSGCVLVPINFRNSVAEIRYVLDDAEVACIIATTDFTSLADEAFGGDRLGSGRIAIGDTACARWVRWQDVVIDSDQVSPVEHPALLQMYTSGTTGKPKGAQLGHAAFLHLVTHAPELWDDWNHADVNLIVTPLFHVGAIVLLLVAYAAGAATVIRKDFTPAGVLKDIDQEGITRLFLVPTMIKSVLEAEDVATTDFGSLRQIIYAAAPIPKAVQEQAIALFKCGLGQVYGMTETSGAITYLAQADHHGPDARLESCGRAMPGTDIRILDAAGEPLPPRRIGEIAIKSQQIMLGYWKRDEANRLSFADGWFLSGDAGMLDEQGYLYVQDRLKDMIITGGENVYPAEVEAALITHPAVAEVAVVGLPDDRWGEAVTAVVVPKEGASVTIEELRAHASNSVAGYKLPKQLRLQPVLPKNATGKVIKYALRELLKGSPQINRS